MPKNNNFDLKNDILFLNLTIRW